MGEDTRGSRQGRLLDMLSALMEGDRLDRNSAATRFGIKPVSANRLLLLLKRVPGIRVETRGGRRVYSFDRASVEAAPTLAEGLAASFGASFARLFRGTRYERDLRSVRDRLLVGLRRTQRDHFTNLDRKFVVVSSREELLQDREDILDEVLDAVLRQRVLKVSYQRFGGRIESRSLTPYSIAVAGMSLYVIAPEADGQPHPFRFARIRKAESTSQVFEYPAVGLYDPEVVFRDSIGVWVDSVASEVHINLGERWATYLADHRWHPSQVVRPQPDGTFDVRLLVRINRELEDWILGFGEDVVVVEPTDLRERIAARLESAVARYR